MFSALSLLVFCFLFFFEALVLARSLSFGNLVSRSCSTYFDKVTTFSLLKISFSSSVSHETMSDFIVSFNCNRVFWYKGQVARKCCSSSIIGSKNGRCDKEWPEDRSIFYNTSSTIYCLIPVWSDISGFC